MIIGSRREIVLLLIIGAVIGVAAGLYIAWELWPVQYYDTDPSDLKREYVTDYMVMIAEQHAFDGDTERARARLQELGLTNIEESVGELTNYYMAEGGNLGTVRALAGLSYALGVGTSGMAIFLQTATPTPTPPATSTPLPTATVAPTSTKAPTASPTITATPTEVAVTTTPTTPTPQPTATATSQPIFLLTERRRICSMETDTGKVEVFVQEADGTGIPGMAVEITWEDGEETFFTGLKPDHGAGYADFVFLDLSQEYDITLPLSGDTASMIVAHPVAAGCPEDSASVSWQLTFVGNRG